MKTISTFTMDAKKANFTNSKINSIRVWFRRMVEQAILNSTDDRSLSIIMRPSLWECVSRLYACDTDGSSCETVSIVNTQKRHRTYLKDLTLPVAGYMYPIELDDNIPNTEIHFASPHFKGCIENINCKVAK